MKKRMFFVLIIFGVFLIESVIPGLATPSGTLFYAYEEHSNNYVKLQGHALFADTTIGGSTDWIVNIRNYRGSDYYGHTVKIFFSITAFGYSTTCDPVFGCESEIHYQILPPVGMMAASSEITKNEMSNAYASWNVKVGVNKAPFYMDISSGGGISSKTINKYDKTTSSGYWRDIGYLQYGINGLFSTFDGTYVEKIKISNDIARSFYNAQNTVIHYSDGTVQYKTLQGLYLQVYMTFRNVWNSGPTYTFIMGDRSPSFDIGFIQLKPGENSCFGSC